MNLRETKSNRNIKIALIIATVILAIGLLGYLFIYIQSTKAIRSYVEKIDKQYSEITTGKNIDQRPVQLDNILLGQVANPKYNKAQKITTQYDKLVARLSSYQSVTKTHNELVSIYNKGLEANSELDSNILNLTNSLLTDVKTNYPKWTESNERLSKLSQKVSSSTSFSEISGEMSSLLHITGKELDKERELIEKQRAEFQSAVNSLAK